MRRHTWSASLLALPLLLAGCTGGGSDVGPPQDTDSTTDPYNTTSPPPDVMAPAPGVNQTRNETRYEYDERTGSVSGVELSASGPSEEESIDVRVGALRFYVNVTVEGDDLSVSLSAPDCGGDSCLDTTRTSGGSASFSYEAPMEGSWTLTLEPAGVGPVDAEYTVEVAQEVPA